MCSWYDDDIDISALELDADPDASVEPIFGINLMICIYTLTFIINFINV